MEDGDAVEKTGEIVREPGGTVHAPTKETLRMSLFLVCFIHVEI